MGKHLSAHSTNLLPARGQIIANDQFPLLPCCPSPSSQSVQVICWLGRDSIPAPVPESRTCRGHIRRCDKANADLPALSHMGTASCSSLCCNCSLASICICDGPLAAFHNCAVVRRSFQLLLVAASLGVALLNCCCCCLAFFDMWESVTKSC